MCVGEHGCVGDVTYREGGSGMEAYRDVVLVGVDNAGKHFRYVDGCVFRAQEAWVIAAVAKEELLFNASIGVSERTALGLEEWAAAFARSDDIKPHEEVGVGKNNDVLCHDESFAKGVALRRGILCVSFEECDEEGEGAQSCMGGSVPRGIRC